MKRIKPLILAIAILAVLTFPVLAQGGATPGLARYNAFVTQLTNVGCSPIIAAWGRSLWACPVGQLWTLRYFEDTDTATIRRIR